MTRQIFSFQPSGVFSSVNHGIVSLIYIRGEALLEASYAYKKFPCPCLMNGAIIYYILTTFLNKSTPNITFWTCTWAVDSVVSSCIRIYVKLVVSIWFRNHRGGWGKGGNYLLIYASDWRLMQRRKWIYDWLIVNSLTVNWLIYRLLD